MFNRIKRKVNGPKVFSFGSVSDPWLMDTSEKKKVLL